MCARSKREGQKPDLREQAVHGTDAYPYATYAWDGKEAFPVPLHWHEEMEIIRIERGPYRVTVNAESYAGNGPALFFVAAGEIHSIHMEAGTVENAVVFAGQSLTFERYDSLQDTVLHPLLEGTLRFPRVLRPSDDVWEEAGAIYAELYEAATRKEIVSYLRFKAGVYSLLACLYERGRLSDTGRSREDEGRINTLKRVLDHIGHNFDQHLSVEEIADKAGMNAQYFCRYFKKNTGKTVTEYINDVRIRQAVRLLGETDEKILNIAMECGYGNMGYFIKRFRQSTGMTPSDYREGLKKSK